MNDFLLVKEIPRKIIHLSTSFFALMLYGFGRDFCIPYFLLICFSFILFDFIRQKNQKLKSLYNSFFLFLTRDSEDDNFTGASYLCLSVIIVSLCFDEKIAIVSLLIMSVSDPFAALLGSCFGNFKLYQKTLEGTITFFIVSCLIMMCFDFSYSVIVAVALFCSVTELLSDKIGVDDNLLIPIVSSCTLVFL
jgi:dolichol kinase